MYTQPRAHGRPRWSHLSPYGRRTPPAPYPRHAPALRAPKRGRLRIVFAIALLYPFANLGHIFTQFIPDMTTLMFWSFVAPLIAIASCFAGSATAILVAPLVPAAFETPRTTADGTRLPAVSAERARGETPPQETRGESPSPVARPTPAGVRR